MILKVCRLGTLCLALPVLLLAVTPALARDTIPANITGEVALSGQLELTSAVRVDSGAVLIIGAGTRIDASPGSSLDVRGTLIVDGTAEDPVIITAAEGNTWSGINFGQGSEGKLKHLKIDRAKVGIGMIAARVKIENTLVTGAEKGIHLIKEANAQILNCTIRGNEVGLIVEMKSRGSVRGCTLVNNKAGVGISSGGVTDLLANRFTGNQIGVRVFQRFPGRIAGNLFENNSVGIRLEQNGPDTIVEKNRFTGSSEAALMALSYTSPVIRNNFISGGKYGILAHQFSSPKIANNHIEEMDEAIHLNKKSTSSVTGNVITRSRIGLFLDFSSYPDARDNRFEDNELHVKLGRFQSTHWETAAGSKKIVLETAARAKSRNPRLAKASEQFPESVDLAGNWWDEKTRSEMNDKGTDPDIGSIFDGHDLPEVSYEGFGEEKYRLDKVAFSPVLEAPPNSAGLTGWEGRKVELGF